MEAKVGDIYDVIIGGRHDGCGENYTLRVESIGYMISYSLGCSACKKSGFRLECNQFTWAEWVKGKYIISWDFVSDTTKRCKYDGKTKVKMPVSSLKDNTDEVKWEIRRQLVPVTMREWPRCSVNSMNKVEIDYTKWTDQITGSLRCRGCYP